MKLSNLRFPATRIPMLQIFGIDYISGDATYNIADPTTMVGTYWYDPIAFMTEVKDITGYQYFQACENSRLNSGFKRAVITNIIENIEDDESEDDESEDNESDDESDD